MSFNFSTSLCHFTSIFTASPERHELLATKSSLHNSASTFAPPPTRRLSPDFTPEQLLRSLRLQNDETSALRLLEWASKQPKFVPMCSVYEEILRKLGKVGSFESMLCVLEEMKLAGSEIRRGTFSILVNSYARFEFYDEILGVVEMMEVGFGLKPDKHFYNFILKVLVDGNELKLARTAYSDMVDKEINPNVSTFRIMIKGLCRAHQIRPAILMMGKMISHGLFPDERTIRMLMQGCVEEGYLDGTGCQQKTMSINDLVSGLLKAGRFGEALCLLKTEVIHVQVEEGFDPNSNMCKQNSIQEATKVADVLINKGNMRDVCPFNSLIHYLCVTGNHGVAMELFEKMKSEGCRPDVCTYNILIDSFCSMHRFDEAMSLMKEMELTGCARSVVTYNILINGFCKNKWVEEAELIFKQMEQQGVSRNLVTYNTLIDGLCKSMKIKEAMDLMGQMMKDGLKPNKYTFNSLLTHFCGTGNMKKAADIVKVMTSNGCEPDIVTYNTIIRGLCKASRVELDFAIRILKTLEVKGMIITPHAYNPVIHELFKRNRRMEAMELFREMTGKSDPPNAITYNIVFGGLCNGLGPIGDAIDFAVEMIEKGFVPEFSSFFTLAEGLCALSMEKTLAKLAAMLMEKANLSDSEISMIKGFLNVHKYRDGLLTLGDILDKTQNSNKAKGR